jgi:hypothetical protein
MRAFISYVHDEQSKRFATWLYEALKTDGSPLEPWIDFVDLPPGWPFDRRLPQAVNGCHVLLFVWARHTPDSDACMDELRFARDFGKPILPIRVDSDLEWHPHLSAYPSVDFTQDRADGLRHLFKRIKVLDRPEGQIAQLEERLRRKRDQLRRLVESERPTAQQEIMRLEERLKELLAEAQHDAGDMAPPEAVPSYPVVDRPFRLHAVERDNIISELGRADLAVILIIGPEGIGKTHLVRELLQSENGPARTGGHPDGIYRQARGPRSFTAASLVDLLESAIPKSSHEDMSAWWRRPEVTVFRKLEALVNLLGERRIVVVLDSGEALLDSDTGRLADPELDEAIELLASQGRTAIKVVFVAREPPLIRRRRWLANASRVTIGRGLSPAGLAEILARLDPADDYGLARPSPEMVERLHSKTAGLPRAAEIIHGILSAQHIAEAERHDLKSLSDIVEALSHVPEEEVLDFLVSRLLGGLSPSERRTMQALAAFGVPVDAAAVAYALPGESLAQIERTLRRLKGYHLVRRVDESRYYVQPPDDHRALELIRFVADPSEPDRRELILRAASYFAIRRTSQVSGVGDLEPGFVEIDLLLRAEESEAAFRAVELLDDCLDNWGCRWLLEHQRKQLRGRLSEEFAEMANLQALGDIALQRDDLVGAESLYRQAISYVDRLDQHDQHERSRRERCCTSPLVLFCNAATRRPERKDTTAMHWRWPATTSTRTRKWYPSPA